MAMMDMIPLDEDTEPMVLDIMNGAYSAALRLYVVHFGKKEDVVKAELTAVSEENFTLRYTDKAGAASELTLPYTKSSGETLKVNTVGKCRKAFVEMARVASEATGEPIALPENDSSSRPAMSPEEQERQEAQLLSMLQQMQALGEGRDSDAPSGRPQPPATGIRTLHDGSGGADRGNNPMEAMMAAMMAAKGKGKGKPEPKSTVFTGEGHSLGSSSGDTTAPSPTLIDKEELSKNVREVDTNKPTLKLRIRLLDRKAVEVEVNHDFTVKDLRAWLELNHASSFTRNYVLMDGAGFPPKKLADLDATMDQLGLTKAGSSIECRPA